VQHRTRWFVAGSLVVMTTALLAQAPSSSPADTQAAVLLRDSEALWHKRQFNAALLGLATIDDDYIMTASAPEAGLWTGRVLAALGDPVSAMEEFQHVRDLWPHTASAATGLAQATLLGRLYARPAGAPAFGAAERLAPEKVDAVTSIAVTARGGVFRAGDRTVDVILAADGDRAPAGPFTRPRLAVDADGRLVVFDGGRLLQPAPAKAIEFSVPRVGKAHLLDKVLGAVQLSSGEWLVMDEDEKMIQRFSRDGVYLEPFEASPGKGGPVKAVRLAVDPFDEVAALDDDGSRIVIFDATGALKGTIPYRRRIDPKNPQDSYELKDPRDLTFDVFGDLDVLDQKAIAIFSPYAAGPRPAPAPGAVENRGDDYHLKALFAETPDKGRDGFRATAFGVDRSGAVYLYDESLKQVLVYR